MEIFIPVSLALVIGLVHFFGEEIDEYTGTYNFLIVSFSAGLTVSYFFSTLIPEVMSNLSFPVQNASILAGFSAFYVLEEVLYKRGQNLGEIKTEFKEAHSLFIVFYHVVIGMILGFLASESFKQMLLFFLPVLLHTLVNSLSIKEMHEEMLQNIYVKVFASLATLVGVLITLSFDISAKLSYNLLGIVGGAFIYIVIHDALDPRRERPVGFISGVSAFIVFMFAVTGI